MKLDELMIPAVHVDLFYALIARNGGVLGAAAKDELTISKEAAIELFIRLGAGAGVKNEIGVRENEKMNVEEGVEEEEDGNQGVDVGMPEVLVEMWGQGEQNLIRAIMEFKKLPLKEVAERYGGKSAAANISNFLAKSDRELGAMRLSTMTRLAKALDCPLDWLTQLKEQDSENKK